jgi:uncharacterized protein (TIGR03067 family)
MPSPEEIGSKRAFFLDRPPVICCDDSRAGTHSKGGVIMWRVALAGMVCSVAIMARAAGPPDEMKKLEGTWLVVKATYDGKPEEGFKGLVFAGAKLTLKVADGKDQKFTYKIDLSQKPKTMDFTSEKKENAKLGKAIYELDGEALKVCLGPPEKRPTDFTDKGQVLIVLKRQK